MNNAQLDINYDTLSSRLLLSVCAVAAIKRIESFSWMPPKKQHNDEAEKVE
jgi:hypothetical protein